jgi:hypothetical protein
MSTPSLRAMDDLTDAGLSDSPFDFAGFEYVFSQNAKGCLVAQIHA